MNFESFIWLVFAHVIGDIALQGDFIAMNKGKYKIVMVWHCLIWTACICVCLQWLGIYSLPKAGFLFIWHYIIDTWKCKKTNQFPSWHLYADQLYHLIQLCIVFIG